MALIDDTEMRSATDGEVEEARQQIEREQERRSSLAITPNFVYGQAQAYVAAGGDVQDIIDALERLKGQA